MAMGHERRRVALRQNRMRITPSKINIPDEQKQKISKANILEENQEKINKLFQEFDFDDNTDPEETKSKKKSGRPAKKKVSDVQDI